MNKRPLIKTKHGNLQIPFFMPDATRGLVKQLDSEELILAGVESLVVNTYHLWLQPGTEVIKEAGGIHKFIKWDRPILSDSGGFQVFSLIHSDPKRGEVRDDKVVFKSPIDGAHLEFTPEMSIQIQFELGVDMMVCLDDCPPNDASPDDIQDSVRRTLDWAQRCKDEYNKQIKERGITNKERPLLFSVIQGGGDLKLRKYCAQQLINIGFDGYGFGALPTDSQGKFNDELLKKVAALIPDEALKFALGVGNPGDIVKCNRWGWDMFDCVIPTREGRHGKLFYRRGSNTLATNRFYNSLNISNARFKNEHSPINPNSQLELLRNYSLAYLHHLFRLKDPLGSRLASLNNLEFYNTLMRELKNKKI